MAYYIDNAATTQLSEDMKKYIISLMDMYGNPSSKYSIGQKTREIIESARNNVARFIHGEKECIYFTCGGSASNTMAIKGYIARNECEILYSPIAHKSIIQCIKSCKKATPLAVDSNGKIDIDDLNRKCLYAKKPLVIIDYANSELGVIQDIKKIIDDVHFYKGIVYLDCTASIPSIPLNVEELDVDMCGFSGHKLGALKGSGILYKKQNIDIEPLVYGTQENGLFGGTENVLGIASIGKAISDYNYSIISPVPRDYVYRYIQENICNSYLVGSLNDRLVTNLYMCFQGVDAESLMLFLDLNGIQASTGSACNSNEIQPSTILSEIGMDEQDMYSCIRMTFTGQETKDELDYICKKITECIEQLRSMK